jgi:hypothetical protein
LPQRDQTTAGEFVAAVKFLDDLQIVCPGKIDRPGIPVLEGGFELREFG